jgi:hypothetical protein
MKHLVALCPGLGTVAGWLATSDIGEGAWPPVHAMAGLRCRPRRRRPTEPRDRPENSLASISPGWTARLHRATTLGLRERRLGQGDSDSRRPQLVRGRSILVDEARNRTVALIQERAAERRDAQDRRLLRQLHGRGGHRSQRPEAGEAELEAVSAISDKRALARALGGSLRSMSTRSRDELLHRPSVRPLRRPGLDDPSRNVAYLCRAASACRPR